MATTDTDMTTMPGRYGLRDRSAIKKTVPFTPAPWTETEEAVDDDKCMDTDTDTDEALSEGEAADLRAFSG